MRTCSPRLAKEKYCTGCMACSDKLEQLIKSETYRNSIVNEADKLVCSDFNIITICNKIEKIYENM
ncbi:hypothetical protein E7X23_26115 [Bacteroides fragilis]|nr:hypothetical protein E7X23_26115 [Bacteroides fragilis]